MTRRILHLPLNHGILIKYNNKPCFEQYPCSGRGNGMYPNEYLWAGTSGVDRRYTCVVYDVYEHKLPVTALYQTH